MPYNGQSKTIENAFYRFQAQVLHAIWHFTGQNVNAKKLNSKPNLEFIEENAYALPTFEELKNNLQGAVTDGTIRKSTSPPVFHTWRCTA